MAELQPYPFQERNVEHFLSLPHPRHLWVTDETGLGKSVTFIEAAKRLEARRVLVVTEGMVRPGWLERFAQWWPERAHEVGAITMGKGRRNLSKPAQERLAKAYAAPIQVVSYDLLGHIDPWGWDLICLDEIHELVSRRSAVSKQLRKIFGLNPGAGKMGLTATLLSAEPKNTWNLLDLFFPGRWGTAQESGEPPWWFQKRYCNRFENEHGVSYSGLNEVNSAAFAAKLRAVCVRTLRSEVAHLLPPIDCSPLLIEVGNKASDRAIAIDWLKTAAAESTHVSLFTYYRDSAAWLAAEIAAMRRFSEHSVQLITGANTPEQRHARLASLKASPRGILVGTMDALGTGISLTAFPQYLITEVTTTANKLVQLLGRFSRLDSTAPSRGAILMREGRDDDKIMTLRERLENFNALIRAGQGEQQLMGVLEAPMAGAGFDRRLDDLIANFVGTLDDDDEDEAIDA